MRYVLFAVVPAFVRHNASLADVAAHLTMTHGFFVRFAQAPWSGPLWTVAVDAQFYLLLPLLALPFAAFVRRRPKRERRISLWSALALVVVLSLVVRAVVFARVPGAFGDPDVLTVYARNVVGMGGAFALGIAIAAANLIHGRRHAGSRSGSAGSVRCCSRCSCGAEARTRTRSR